MSHISDAINRGGWTEAQIMAWLGVSKSTLKRYKKNLPIGAENLLFILAGGLPWPAWAGWRVDRWGMLHCPEQRLNVTPGDIAWMDFMIRQPLSLRVEYQQAETDRHCGGNIVALHHHRNKGDTHEATDSNSDHRPADGLHDHGQSAV